MILYCSFFLFKQKTAYEMRISDWSSDVCSSDLIKHEWSAGLLCRQVLHEGTLDAELREQRVAGENIEQDGAEAVGFALVIIEYGNVRQSFDRLDPRSEERRVGKGGVSTVRSRLSPAH